MTQSPLDIFCQFDSPKDSEEYRVLHTTTERIPPKSITKPTIQKLIAEMIPLMQTWGIGLAANQVGANKQLFMIEFTATSDRYGNPIEPVPFQVFINPRIVKVSQERSYLWHGCLSAVRKDRGKVATYDRLTYEAYDEHGQLTTGELKGMAAIIFQHEFRHLLGGVYAEFADEFATNQELAVLAEEKKLSFITPCGDDIPHLLADYRVGDSIETYATRRR